MIHVRPAGLADAAAMARLLNAIIEQGGTTAMTRPLTPADLLGFMAAFPHRAAWHLAEDDSGRPLGFQMIEPHAALPPDTCDIATFTQLGKTRIGIGSALFERSKTTARALGYTWINATIRADNTSGLAYYQSRGFEQYKLDRDIALEDGSIVDKISKRYRL